MSVSVGSNMSQDASQSSSSELEQQEPEWSLVEVSPGLAVLYGESVPEGMELVPFELIPDATSEHLTDQLSVASGLANVVAQGAQGFTNVQGLVKLAPQTVEALSVARPMTSGGWNLGSVVNSKGQITASVRWAPVAGVKSAQVLAALGPAAAMLAMQVQLASISRRVDENIELTRDVLRAIHQDHWTSLLGLHETTNRAVEEARQLGTVNGHIYAAIASKESELRKQRHVFTDYVQTHIAAMDTDGAGQRAYIQKNSEQIFADVHGILMAEGAWYKAQVLRAGHIMNDVANAEHNQTLLTTLVETTQREHTEAMDNISGLLESLERQCRLMAELPAERALPFTSKKQSIKQTTEMAIALAERVSELRGLTRKAHATPNPQVAVFQKEIPQSALNILQWAMTEPEPLLALANVNVDRLIGDDAYLGVTPSKFFITRESQLHKQGVIEQEYELDDVRYVRFTEREKDGPLLDIITSEENIRLSFDDWANQEESLEQARRVGAMFATVMNVPETERKEEPLMVEHRLLPEASEQQLALEMLSATH